MSVEWRLWRCPRLIGCGGTVIEEPDASDDPKVDDDDEVDEDGDEDGD